MLIFMEVKCKVVFSNSSLTSFLFHNILAICNIRATSSKLMRLFKRIRTNLSYEKNLFIILKSVIIIKYTLKMAEIHMSSKLCVFTHKMT